MRRYSPSEAIGPAWEQTTAVMWQKRRWLTGFKIAFIALLAEAAGATFNFNLPGRHHGAPVGGAAAAAALGMMLVFGTIFFIIGIILFYVGSRMQFVHFTVITTGQTEIQPLWHRFGRLTWRWIGFKLLIMLAFLVPFLPVVYKFTRSMADVQPGQMPHFGHIISFFLVIFCITIPFVLFYTAARDFVLPSVALEGTTVRFGLHRFLLWFQAEPAGILLFLFLRLVLGFVLAILTEILLFIALLISAIPFGIIGVMLWIPVRHASTGPQIAMGALLALFVLVYVVWAIFLVISTFGTLCTFYIAWGAYYLGGRYPLLGNLLEPPYTNETFTPPPSFPSSDNSNGPDLPLNPQPV